MHHFAGNMLQVKGANESKYMVMSKAARDSLSTQIRSKKLRQMLKF